MSSENSDAQPCCMMNAGGYGCRCHADRERDELRAEIARLTRERDEARAAGYREGIEAATVLVEAWDADTLPVSDPDPMLPNFIAALRALGEDKA